MLGTPNDKIDGLTVDEVRLLQNEIQKRFPNGQSSFSVIYDARKEKKADESTWRAAVKGKGPTLSILTTGEGYICGAFTLYAYQGDGNFHEDQMSFLFRLRGRKGVVQPLFLRARLGSRSQIRDSPQGYGPAFSCSGSGYGLEFFNGSCGLNSTSHKGQCNCTNGRDYEDPPAEDGAYALTGSANSWSLANVQTFLVTISDRPPLPKYAGKYSDADQFKSAPDPHSSKKCDLCAVQVLELQSKDAEVAALRAELGQKDKAIAAL